MSYLKIFAGNLLFFTLLCVISALPALFSDPQLWHELPVLIIAFTTQLPLVFALSLVFSLVYMTSGVLLLVMLPIFLLLFFAYVSTSQLLYANNSIYLGIPEFSVFFQDPWEHLLYAFRDGSGIAIIGLVGVVASFLVYKLLVSITNILGSFFALIIIFLISVGTFAGLTGFKYSSPDTQRRIIYHSFPVTCGVFSFAKLLFPVANGTLSQTHRGLPLISLHQYSANNVQRQPLPNVFFILLESVPSREISREVTPNIYALAQESLFFDRAYSPSNHSGYAQTSIHSGQYALRSPHLQFFSDVDYPKVTLFDILPAFGYHTAVFSSQNENWNGIKRFYLSNSSIDHFISSEDIAEDRVPFESSLFDYRTRELAEEYIDRNAYGSAPLFMYLNFQSTHFPYYVPQDGHYFLPDNIDFPYTFIGYPKDKAAIVHNRFKNSLREVDKQVGLFFEYLKKRKMYDDSMVVVSADHGEAFYEQGFATHGTALYDDQVRCFIVMKNTRNKPKGQRRDAVSLIDIPPTILSLLGLGQHPSFQGFDVSSRPRVGDSKNIFITSQTTGMLNGVVRYPWKLTRRESGETQLINLILDPGEQKEFSTSHPHVALLMNDILDGYINNQLAYYAESEKKNYPPRW